MIEITRTRKERESYNEYGLYDINGFVVDDTSICLIDSNLYVIWFNDDGFICVDAPWEHKYSCSYLDVTIGEYLHVSNEVKPYEPPMKVTAIFQDDEDIKITFNYKIR